MSLFISFEGGEGVGKSALIRGFAKSFSSQQLFLTREPGGTFIADQIRGIFSQSPPEEPLTKITEFMLLSAARSQHVAYAIKPALERGDWVVSDRYADSSRVYQGLVGGLEQGLMETVIARTTQGIEPHITFLLDCDPDIASQRRHQRSDIDAIARFDNAGLEFHHLIRESYLKLAKLYPKRIVVINTEKPVPECLEEISRHVEKLMLKS